jgi:LGFP repeat
MQGKSMTTIDDKSNWLLINGLSLGQPTAAEKASGDGIGKVRTYEFGNIYWHPAVEAFEVHGAILAHYITTGAEQSTLGYPISDELPLPDGNGGRYANLVADYTKLRDPGFLQDPPFVFEPDHTGSNQAWVVGIDNPTIHISPDYFYLDRDQLVPTLIHERAHTVLRLPRPPGGIPGVPADGVASMTRDEAIRNAYCYEGLVAALH